MLLYDGTLLLYDDTLSLYDGTLLLYDDTLSLYDGTLSLYDGTLSLYDDTLSLYDDTSFKHVFRKTKWLFQFFSNTLYIQENIRKFCWQIIFFILSKKGYTMLWNAITALF